MTKCFGDQRNPEMVDPAFLLRHGTSWYSSKEGSQENFKQSLVLRESLGKKRNKLAKMLLIASSYPAIVPCSHFPLAAILIDFRIGAVHNSRVTRAIFPPPPLRSDGLERGISGKASRPQGWIYLQTRSTGPERPTPLHLGPTKTATHLARSR